MDFSDFQKILYLSELDSRLADIEEELKDLKDSAVAVESAVLSAGKKALSADGEKEKLELEIKEAELSLMQAEERLSSRRASQNLIKDAQAAEKLEAEEKTLKAEIDALEEKVLLLMENRNKAEAEALSIKAELGKIEIQSRAELEKIKKSEAALLALKKEQEIERSKAANQCPQEILSRYEAVKKKKFPALAACILKDGKLFCSGCGIAVTASQADELKKGAGLINCMNCFRLIYVKR